MPSKKKVDDGRPKRPQSAYFLWMNGSRAAINKEKPGMSIGEFGKYCGATWKTMEDEEKQTWQKKADAAKETYAVELEKWKATQNTM
jgi:hypothetical protein